MFISVNFRSKVSLCTDALRWDSSIIGVSVHQNFNIELFSETVNHRILKLGMMVVYSEDFPKMYTLITSCDGQRSSGAIIYAKLGIFAKNALFDELVKKGESVY